MIKISINNVKTLKYSVCSMVVNLGVSISTEEKYEGPTFLEVLFAKTSQTKTWIGLSKKWIKKKRLSK